MSKVLNLSLDLALPLNAVTEKLAWLGRTGSGKTYGAMKLAELMLNAGAQIGALDPVGVWRALRVPVAKDGAAFEVVVFGGLYGDLPLEPTAGELIADLVCDRGFSFVLDVSQFIPTEQQRFVRAFAERFFHRKKSKPSAVHLFMEECQEFIPENPSGLEAATLGAMQRLWKLGRNFGIGGSLISQRPQEIAKKALNMSGTLFAFQMTGPQERKTVKDWVADHGVALDIVSVLQKLEVGQPHVESPMFLKVSQTIRILSRVTADLSSTPEVGVSKAAARALTPIDIEQLKTSMAATIERAKAEDPKELQREVVRLRAELKKAQTAKPAAEPSQKTRDVPAVKDAQIKRVESLLVRFEAEGAKLANRAVYLAERGDRLAKGQTLLHEAAALLRSALHGARREGEAVPQPSHPKARERERFFVREAARPVAPPTPRQGNGDGRLGKGERAILIAIAQHPEGVTREQLTVLTGYKSSTRNAYLQRLGLGGMVVQDGDRFIAADAGVQALGSDYRPLPTGDALRKHWLATLPDGERRVLEVVVGQHPSAVEREVISEATGYKSSTRNAYLQRLSARRLVRADRDGVRASEELFG